MHKAVGTKQEKDPQKLLELRKEQTHKSCWNCWNWLGQEKKQKKKKSCWNSWRKEETHITVLTDVKQLRLHCQTLAVSKYTALYTRIRHCAYRFKTSNTLALCSVDWYVSSLPGLHYASHSYPVTVAASYTDTALYSHPVTLILRYSRIVLHPYRAILVPSYARIM